MCLIARSLNDTLLHFIEHLLREHFRLSTQLRQQPLSEIRDTGIDPCRWRHLIVMTGWFDRSPFATIPDMGPGMISIIDVSAVTKRRTTHTQRLKDLPFDKRRIIKCRLGLHQITDQAENNILVAITLARWTDKVDSI